MWRLPEDAFQQESSWQGRNRERREAEKYALAMLGYAQTGNSDLRVNLQCWIQSQPARKAYWELRAVYCWVQHMCLHSNNQHVFEPMLTLVRNMAGDDLDWLIYWVGYEHSADKPDRLVFPRNETSFAWLRVVLHELKAAVESAKDLMIMAESAQVKQPLDSRQSWESGDSAQTAFSHQQSLLPEHHGGRFVDRGFAGEPAAPASSTTPCVLGPTQGLCPGSSSDGASLPPQLSTSDAAPPRPLPSTCAPVGIVGAKTIDEGKQEHKSGTGARIRKKWHWESIYSGSNKNPLAPANGEPAPEQADQLEMPLACPSHRLNDLRENCRHCQDIFRWMEHNRNDGVGSSESKGDSATVQPRPCFIHGQHLQRNCMHCLAIIKWKESGDTVLIHALEGVQTTTLGRPQSITVSRASVPASGDEEADSASELPTDLFTGARSNDRPDAIHDQGSIKN